MGQNFYIVNYPAKTDFAEAAPITAKYDHSRFAACPHCGERVSGSYWEQPREIVLTRKKTPDFLYAYCDTVPFVLSEKAIKEITQAGLKGIERVEAIETVRFQRKTLNTPSAPHYYHIELARSRITVDHQTSIIEYGSATDRPPCPLCRQVPATYDFFRSLSFHTNEYEGYDIFQTYELGEAVVLSERFVTFYENSTLTNLRYEPAQKHGAQLAAYFLDGNADS